MGNIPDRRGRNGRQYGLPVVHRLHLRRDVILREYRSTIRPGSSPQPVAALRNAMLHVVRDAPRPLAETREIFAENRQTAIQTAQRGFL